MIMKTLAPENGAQPFAIMEIRYQGSAPERYPIVPRVSVATT